MNPLSPTPYTTLQSPTAAIPSYHIQGQPTSSIPQQTWPQVRGTVVSPTSQQAQPQVYEINRSASSAHAPPPLINSGTIASSSSSSSAAGTASNPTVKYVCCGHCRQWLLSPVNAQYVHCPTCDCVNHCQVATYNTYLILLTSYYCILMPHHIQMPDPMRPYTSQISARDTWNDAVRAILAPVNNCVRGMFT